jgi:hypothetical protein
VCNGKSSLRALESLVLPARQKHIPCHCGSARPDYFGESFAWEAKQLTKWITYLPLKLLGNKFPEFLPDGFPRMRKIMKINLVAYNLG